MHSLFFTNTISRGRDESRGMEAVQHCQLDLYTGINLVSKGCETSDVSEQVQQPWDWFKYDEANLLNKPDIDTLKGSSNLLDEGEWGFKPVYANIIYMIDVTRKAVQVAMTGCWDDSNLLNYAGGRHYFSRRK